MTAPTERPQNANLQRIRKLPDADTILKHRENGLTDQQIGALYGVGRTAVSSYMRLRGLGRAGDNPNRPRVTHLPDHAKLLEELRNDTRAVVAERYNVTVADITHAVRRASRAGFNVTKSDFKRPAPANAGVRKPRSKPEPKAPPVRENPGYVEPDLTGLCGARELLGSRVCDKHPHSRNTAHEGAGPKDERAEFWGQK